MNESSIGPFLENESSGAARKRYNTAYAKRGGLENVQRLADAVTIRQQLAPLLGFPTWAAYQLDVKMAKTPQRATALWNRWVNRSCPRPGPRSRCSRH